MSRWLCLVGLFWLGASALQARHAHHMSTPADVPLKLGGVQFAIPAAWQAETPETAARAGQWLIASPSGGDPVRVVAFYFGPGLGGTARQNIAGWAAQMGASSAVNPQKRTAGGHLVSEVLIPGVAAEPGAQPGLPPSSHPGYALWGAVLENPSGTIFWRATGPAAQVTALAPQFDHVLDTVQPAPAASAATP